MNYYKILLYVLRIIIGTIITFSICLIILFNIMYFLTEKLDNGVLKFQLLEWNTNRTSLNNLNFVIIISIINSTKIYDNCFYIYSIFIYFSMVFLYALPPPLPHKNSIHFKIFSEPFLVIFTWVVGITDSEQAFSWIVISVGLFSFHRSILDSLIG